MKTVYKKIFINFFLPLFQGFKSQTSNMLFGVSLEIGIAKLNICFTAILKGLYKDTQQFNVPQNNLNALRLDNTSMFLNKEGDITQVTTELF